MTENKAPQALDVTVKNYEGVADLSPVGTFVFCILCFAFWAVDLGFLGDGATTAIGFLGLAVFVPGGRGGSEQEGTVPGREYLHTLRRGVWVMRRFVQHV